MHQEREYVGMERVRIWVCACECGGVHYVRNNLR